MKVSKMTIVIGKKKLLQWSHSPAADGHEVDSADPSPDDPQLELRRQISPWAEQMKFGYR